MKTAILISGQFRSGLQCYPGIKKHVLDKIGDYDVYAHLGLDADANDVEVYKPVETKIVEQPFLDEKNYIHRTGRQVYGVQSVLKQLWSMNECLKMVKGDYDWYIRLRPDTDFFTDIENLSAQRGGVYLPKFHNWWGYNDRFAYMSYEWARPYFSRFENMDEYIAQNGIFHPETHLKWTLDRINAPVTRTDVIFDTVRKEGHRFYPEYYFACGDIK